MSVSVPSAPRLLIEADLVPTQGTRFQPTGFPDLGAATYRLHDGTQMLLVESAQSVANRLEVTAWDAGEGRINPALDGLSYVSVIASDGTPLTNSMLEAHRLNSVYIEKSDQFDEIRSNIGYDDGKPFDLRAFARGVCRYDVNSLVHGVFLESIAGVLRIPRTLSGFIEARDVSVVTSGGVKNDRVQAATERDSDATAAEGYGNVPFHRDEFTASSITAYFNLDLAQIRSYGLGSTAERLLYALALWKIRSFLDDGLRIRTACDLDCTDIRVTRPDGVDLPSKDALADDLQSLIFDAQSEGLFAKPPVTEARYDLSATKGKAKKGKAKTVAAGDSEES